MVTKQRRWRGVRDALIAGPVIHLLPDVDVDATALPPSAAITAPDCATCNPPIPGDSRLHEGHVGVRFGDHAPDRWTITLGGIDVTNRCIEALAPQLVILHDEPHVICSDDHPRTTTHHGHVTIARTRP